MLFRHLPWNLSARNVEKKIKECQNTKNFSRPIFITGLPRSGTSMTTGCIHLCGAWIGSTVEGGKYNKKGFFEHKLLRDQINKGILRDAGADESGVSTLPAIDTIPSPPTLQNDVAKIIVSDGYRGRSPWAFKDAKLSLIFPAYVDAFPEAYWVYVQRDPDDVVQSCLRTPFMMRHSTDKSFWQSFVAEYLSRISRIEKIARNFKVISSHKVVCGDFSEIEELTEEVDGLTFRRKKLQKFVDTDLWRGS